MWMSFMSNQMMLLDKSDIAALSQIHFSCLDFLSQTFVIHKTAGESGLVD